MGRGKTKNHYIENATNRQVTFSKRRNGVLKKAKELSILCASEVAVIIMSEKGKLSEYSNTSVRQTIERYRAAMRTQQKNKQAKQQCNSNPERQAKKYDRQALETLAKKYDDIRAYKRKLFGEDLDACSADERHELASKVEAALHDISFAKMRVFQTQMEKHMEEKALLSRKNEELRQELLSQKRYGSADKKKNKHYDFGADLSLATPTPGFLQPN